MNSSITNLTKTELVGVYGGKITSKTSFAYDVTYCFLTVLYYAGVGAYYLCQGARMCKG